MKIRSGYVSNSSSASFLVSYHNSLKGEKRLKIISKLIMLGFEETTAFYPDQYIKGDEKEITEDMRKDLNRDYSFFKINYGKSVSVNEFDVHSDLIKNKIPYIASCHYDQYVVKYDGKKVTVAINYGTLMLMGLLNNDLYRYDEDIYGKPVVEKTPNKFLKEGY